MRKHNVLIVSVYYPPIESIASNRIYSFAKYLDKERFNIFVHTVDEGKEYQNDLANVTVSRVKNDVFFKPLLFNKRTNKFVHYCKVIYNIAVNRLTKNSYQKWIDNSFKYLKKEIRNKNIDLIISSFSPDASHILALKLKKEFPHLKWIADFRDEMSKSPYLDKKTKIKYKNLEDEIFKYANAVTSVSSPILDEFKQMSKNENIIFKEIRNGYDFDLKEQKSNNELFTITYTGNFYGSRNPDNFLKALSNFVEKRGVKVSLKLIGVKTHFNIPNNLEGMVEIVKSVPHKEITKYLLNSDALLLIHPSNGRKGIFTGKLFEYLASLKPIIALVDEEDVASKLIKKANAGYVSDNDNIKKIEEILEKVYNEYRDNIKREYNINIIKQHHRREQAKRLESLIRELIDER